MNGKVRQRLVDIIKGHSFHHFHSVIENGTIHERESKAASKVRQRLVETPRYDAWVERLRIVFKARGAKSELARFMATARGQSLAVWRVNMARILAGQMTNAEDLLALRNGSPTGKIPVKNPDQGVVFSNKWIGCGAPTRSIEVVIPLRH